MNVVRLTRWKPLSSACRKTRLRSGIAAVAASALLVLPGCSGSPDAPATVGPTATPDQPETYEPTLPPYTSEVELSAEDEEDVEELLLLIEQFSNYTSDLTEENRAGLRSIRDNLTDEMYSSYQDYAQDAADGKLSVVGSVSITDSSVWRYDPKRYAMVGVCYRYDHWAVIENDTGRASDGHEPDRAFEKMAYLEADFEADKWLIYNQKFYSDRPDCSDIR